MTKQIIWRQVEVEKSKLAAYLTEYNFQPTKFHIVPHQWLSDVVIIVLVEAEEPNATLSNLEGRDGG